MVEFTGERVIPGHVNADLWSEHLARYAFARRFSAGQRVLDAGCGVGYGSAELAQVAAHVTGLDFDAETATYAQATYVYNNVTFGAGSCDRLPFRDASYDLVVGFEVIEHLANYRDFIAEAARVLTETGIFIVSTPNKKYYAESRAETGPNPYHEHEFEADEFQAELGAAFKNVTLLLQNRVESFAFHPEKTFWPVDARIDRGGGSTGEAHFLIAVCSNGALPEMRSFVYVPKAANILREREQHIELLKKELEQTKQWLRHTGQERDELLELFRNQKLELEAHNSWADELSRQLEATNTRVVDLQTELAREQTAALAIAAGYEAKVRELEDDNAAKTGWARETETRLTSENEQVTAQLAECLKLLEGAEATVEDRTIWAQRAEAERQHLAEQLNAVRASRWVKLGRRVGLGPLVRDT